MSFNADKTKCMIFSRTKQDVPRLVLDNNILEMVDVYKHLGLTLCNNLSWSEHIDRLLKKLQPQLSLIWKLNTKFPRYISEKVFTSFILPQLDYACVLYDSSTLYQKERLDRFHRSAAIACTRAYSNTSTNALLSELGWNPLQTRRDYIKLVYMYKIIHNMCPQYLKALVPTQVSHQYQLRNTNNIAIPFGRTQLYRNSFIPSTITLWNNTDPYIKCSNSLVAFKCHLKKHLFIKKENNVCSLGVGIGYIHFARLRMGMSGLHSHLYKCHIKDSPTCPSCDNAAETIQHYLLECPTYRALRPPLLETLLPLISKPNSPTPSNHMLTSFMLSGITELSRPESKQLLDTVSNYIIHTKSFN